MIIRLATSLVGVILTLASAPLALRQNVRATSIDDSEAYAVYASVLPDEWTVSVAHARTLLFQQETERSRDCMPAGGPLETDWKPVLDSFIKENAVVRRLRSGFSLGMPYEVAAAAEIEASFRAVPEDQMFGWTGFNRRYPNAGNSIMVVSAVGFDPEKRRAMVYMAHSCGVLCGGGRYHFVERVAGSWRESRLPGVTDCQWES